MHWEGVGKEGEGKEGEGIRRGESFDFDARIGSGGMRNAREERKGKKGGRKD